MGTEVEEEIKKRLKLEISKTHTHTHTPQHQTHQRTSTQPNLPPGAAAATLDRPGNDMGVGALTLIASGSPHHLQKRCPVHPVQAHLMEIRPMGRVASP